MTEEEHDRLLEEIVEDDLYMHYAAVVGVDDPDRFTRPPGSRPSTGEGDSAGAPF